MFVVGMAVAGLASALGVGSHMQAREVNEKAKQIVEQAQASYNKWKCQLDEATEDCQDALVALGSAKKRVLEGSIPRFLKAYRNINAIRDVTGIHTDEVSRFSMAPQDVLELQTLVDRSSHFLASGAAGAATGTLVALAASGALPLVTGTLSIAGTALSIGEFGMAASLAGSAVSLGASMTPLAAVAAPVVLFTGISASMAADENLEKAKVTESQAAKATAEMSVKITLCNGIRQKAEMFDSLLGELESLFLPCVILLENCVKRRRGLFGLRKIKAEQLSREELNLVAVTRSLAGAVKAVLDTPILDSDGNLAVEADTRYETTKQSLPELEQEARAAVTSIAAPKAQASDDAEPVALSALVKDAPDPALRLAGIAAVFTSVLFLVLGRVFKVDLPVTLVCSAFIGLYMLDMADPRKNASILRAALSLCLMGAWCFSLWFYGKDLVANPYFLWLDIALGGVLFWLFASNLPEENRRGRIGLCRISGCGCSFCIALLVLFVLYGCLHLFWPASVIVGCVVLLLAMAIPVFLI